MFGSCGDLGSWLFGVRLVGSEVVDSVFNLGEMGSGRSVSVLRPPLNPQVSAVL